MKFTVTRQELLAAAVFASKDDSRYVLNGVLVEIDALKPKLISSDGRRLVVIETIAEQSEDYVFGGEPATLKPDIIKAVCTLSKTVGGKLSPWIEWDITLGVIQFVGTKCTLTIKDDITISAVYPQWRKIIPPKNSVRKPINDLGLNVEFMADFSKANSILEAKSPAIQMNLIGKEEAIEVKMCAVENFYGLIMPCRTDDTLEYQPEFIAISSQFNDKKENDNSPEPEPITHSVN